jgi:hypothetical protein
MPEYNIYIDSYINIIGCVKHPYKKRIIGVFIYLLRPPSITLVDFEFRANPP